MHVIFISIRPTNPVFLSIPPAKQIEATTSQYTEMQIRAILRRTHFNWADEMEEHDELTSSNSGKAHTALRIITSSSSSETSSDTDNPSTPDTPDTPFSRGPSPTFPTFDVAKVQQSRLVVSLDIAGKATDIVKLHEPSEFEWLNLIELTKEYRLYGGSNSQRSGAPITLDLVIPRYLKVTPEEGNQSRTSTISELLDLDRVHVADKKDTGTEDEKPVHDDEAANAEESTEVTETNQVEEGMKDKETLAVDRNSGVEDIDLDKVFGGAADDLFEDYEAQNRAARTGINTRADQTLADAVHASEENNLPRNTSMVLFHTPGSSNNLSESTSATSTLQRTAPVEAEDEADWYVSKWENMCAATQRAKLEGRYEHQTLQAADRSIDWFWEPTNEDNRHKYDPRIFSAAAEPATNNVRKLKATIAVEKRTLHHLNYLQQPVFHKSDTPPEVSLWAVCSGHTKGHHLKFTRRGVVSSQAGKLVDPFSYSGPPELLVYKGTRLRDEVTGYVDKVYHPTGTWKLDQYGCDEVVPHVIGGEPYVDIENGPEYPYCPQPVHIMNQAKEIRRSTDGTTPLYPDNVDPEDCTVNDDGGVHVNGPRSDRGWVRRPSTPLKAVQACADELLDSMLLPPKFDRAELSKVDEDEDGLEELTVLPEQSDEKIAAEDGDIYDEAAATESPDLVKGEKGEQITNEPAGTDYPHLAEAEEVGNLVNEPAATESPHLARGEQGEVIANETAVTDSPDVAESEECGRTANEPAITDSSNLAEGGDCEQTPGEESDNSEASRTTSTQALRDMLESPDFILTQRHVQAVMDGKEDEASAILAQRDELRASAPAPVANNAYETSDDEEQTDYTDTWVRRNVRSVSRQDFLSRWSESAAVQAHAGGESLDDGNPANDDPNYCQASPDIHQASPTSSWSIEKVATPEDLELERTDDEFPGVIAQLRALGEVPPASPEGQQVSDINLDVSSACDAGKEKSPVGPIMGSSSDQDLYAEVLDVVRLNRFLLARDGDALGATIPDATALKPRTTLTGNEIFTSRGYTPPMMVEEEEDLLDHQHTIAMMQEEQADAQAENLLGAYLSHLKLYHRKSWEATSDKVSCLEVAVTEAQTLSERKDLRRTSIVSLFCPLLEPISAEQPAAAPGHNVEILNKSYQYHSSTLPTVSEEKGEDSEVDMDPASNVNANPPGTLPLDQQRYCTKFKLSDYEECSEDMEDGLVWDEDSEFTVEQDIGECKSELSSVNSEQLANMNTENLDALLSDLSGLLGTLPGSENAVQDSPSDLDAVPVVSDAQEEQLDHGTLEQGHLIEEKGQLAEEARKLANREKEVAEREEKLAEEEKKLLQREMDLAEEARNLAEEKAQLARAKKLVDPEAEDNKSEDNVVDHTFDTISCPSEIPPAAPKFNEHFFGSFAIAVGGKASRLAMGLSGVLRSSATVLHRG